MQSLDVVYRYRTLLGKCEAGVGLTFEEIDLLTQIEAAFASGEPRKDGRRWKRVPVDLGAMVRGGELNDRVKVAELAPGGLVLTHAPYVDTGMQVEVVIEDVAAARSYRFKARVQWVRAEASGDHALGLALFGVPVMIHYGPPSAKPAEKVARAEMERLAA